MPEEEEPKRPYIYDFRTAEKPSESDASEEASRQALFSIRDTLLLLTGDCEIHQRQEGAFCEKHGRQVIGGGMKCDDLLTRFSRRRGEEESKAQIQQYVNEILGVKDPRTVKRLTGF
jgi:hypothetical protein